MRLLSDPHTWEDAPAIRREGGSLEMVRDDAILMSKNRIVCNNRFRPKNKSRVLSLLQDPRLAIVHSVSVMSPPSASLSPHHGQ